MTDMSEQTAIAIVRGKRRYRRDDMREIFDSGAYYGFYAAAGELMGDIKDILRRNEASGPAAERALWKGHDLGRRRYVADSREAAP